MARLETLKVTRKQPLLYHAFNITSPFSTATIQLRPLNETLMATETNHFIMVRFKKMPIPYQCDFVIPLNNLTATEGN